MKEALEALISEMVEKGIRFDEARGEFERRFITRVLDRENGNRSLAAQTLGIHRNTLSRKIDELQILPGRSKKPPQAIITRSKNGVRPKA